MSDAIGLVRVYTKPQGHQPDFTDPMVLSADKEGEGRGRFKSHTTDPARIADRKDGSLKNVTRRVLAMPVHLSSGVEEH